ncbi:MAG: hypothetical protein ACK6D4_11425 [Planctomyces sp.]
MTRLCKAAVAVVVVAAAVAVVLVVVAPAAVVVGARKTTAGQNRAPRMCSPLVRFLRIRATRRPVP